MQLITQKFSNRISLEIKTVFLLISLYTVSLIAIPLEAWKAYLTEILPVYLYGLDWCKKPIQHLLSFSPYISMNVNMLLASLLLGTLFIKQHKLVGPLLVFTCISLFNYLYGGQAWVYRFFPVQAGVYLILGLVLGLILQKLLFVLTEKTILLLISTLVLLGAFAILNRELIDLMQERAYYPKFNMSVCGHQGKSFKKDTMALFSSIVENSSINDGVIFLGTGIKPGYPTILQSKRRPASRFLFSVVTLTDFCQKKYDTEYWNELQEKIINTYIEEINFNKPKIVIIQKTTILPILKKYDFFSKCMTKYKLTTDSPVMTYYLVYVRK